MTKTHYFLISSGLLAPEHRRRIGIAIWEFEWLIDRQFKPRNGDADAGLVLNGETITTGRIAFDLGLSIRTVQRNLESLEAGKYIRTEEIPGMGKRYFIANPKRWQFFPTHDRSVMGTHDRSVVGPRQKCLDPHDTSVIANKEVRLLRLKDSRSPAQPSACDGVSASQSKPKKAIPAFDASMMEIPEWLPRDAWREFVGHRKDKKNPLTERAARANLNKLVELHSNGEDPRAVIDQTIAAGWTGLFELKTGKKTPKAQAPTVDAPDPYELVMRQHLRAKAAGANIQ
jgi:hypothetical protein